MTCWFSGKSVADVPLAQGFINSSQKPITVPKSDSSIQDDPWAFNETERSQMSSTSVNVRKLPKVYATGGAKRYQPLVKSFQFQSK